MNNDERYEEDEELPKSKSQIKREMIALQELGEKLVGLNNEQLKRLALPPLLQEAIKEQKKITSRSAKRRQLQYIGRLMRDVEDVSHIEQFFQELETKHSRTNAIHHMLEAWRQRLLSDDEATTQFITDFPHIDRQYFRQLIKNAKKEQESGKPAGAGRLLFRYLKEVHGSVK